MSPERPRTRRCGFLLLAIMLVSCLSSRLTAQFDSASVLGYARDASGAAIPQCTVTLTNVETGIKQTDKSDNAGRYEFPSVHIGTYRVAAEATGFAPSETAPFRLTVNARQRVDLDLKNGTVNEAVTVSSAPTLLETETSSRGQVIFAKQIEDLPLNGRSYADLALLVPGVRKSTIENQTTSSREASFNVNGQRSAFNNFLLDGLDNNSYGTSNQGFGNENIPPSPDAVGEFRIETDNYSAEYGRASGAVINTSIRSGTNQFHGRAWDYLRNTALNAIGPFQPAGGIKPVFIRNQFGGTFGGPIYKDRTFFFVDYEGLRQITRALTQSTLPTAEQTAGTFVLHTTSGATRPIALRNPITGQVYANGVIPTGAMTPFARAVLAALPAANVPVSGTNGYANNYLITPRGTVNDDKGDIRIDHKLNSKLSLFGRFSRHNATIVDPVPIPGQAGGNANGNVHIYNQQVAAGATYVLNSSSLIDFRMGVGWNEGGKTPFGLGQPSLLTANGITNGIPTDPAISRYLNGQAVGGGFSAFGSQTSNPQFQNPFVLNPKVNYTLVHGRQSLKFGYEFQSISTAIDDFNPVYGSDTYSGAFAAVTATCATNVNSTTAAPCTPTDGISNYSTQIAQARDLADFMFGNRSAYQLNNYVVINLRQKMNFFYVQDDIKLLPNLTINAGLRYELATPQYTDGNHQANFDPTTNTLIQATDGSIYNRSLVNMQYNNLAPRIGFSYSADGNTTVRGGYGINYTQFNREGGENLLAYNGPYIVGATINQLPSAGLCTSDTQDQTTCFRQTQQGYSTTLVSPSAFNPLKVQSRYIPRNNPTGYIQTWQLSIQRQLPGNVVLDLGYVGSKGTHLMVLGDQNQATVDTFTSATCGITPTFTNGVLNGQATYTTSGCPTLQSRRPISNFAGIEVATGIGYSNYNSLQFKAEKRYGNGLYLLNSFTYSRGFDLASGHLETANGDNSRVNIQNLASNYGPSGYDQPLNDTTSILYDLPYGKGRRFGASAPRLSQLALGGWQMTIINSSTSGLPLNLNYSASSGFAVDSGLLTYRPNVVGPVIASASNRVKTSTSVTGFFNNANVQVPYAVNAPFGNAQRNSVRGLPFNQLDLGLHKAFPVWRDGTVIDLRGEAFNILNHVNYGGPDTNRSNSTFGTITTAFPARQLQVAAKLIF